MSTAQSRVVFVGNVPYNMGEEQLIDVFKNVGQVVGFRLVFDRETGKPRGYGFCEFADHETAMSAVRNLNNVIVDGRPLRIDLADSDPFLEGKTTTRGELPEESRAAGWRPGGVGGGAMDDFLANLPQGVNVPPGTSSLDVITQTLASMRPGHALEVLHQMKQFIIASPEQARLLLVAHPQLAYALFQALLLHNIVDPAVLHRMLGAAQQQAPPPPQQPPVPTPYAQPPPPAQAVRPPPPPGPYGQMPAPPAHMQPMPAPPPNFYSAAQQQQQQQQQHVYPAPTPAPPVPVPAPALAAPSAMPDQQKVLMQVLQLTPEQIAILPEADRKAIMDLRSKFLGALPTA